MLAWVADSDLSGSGPRENTSLDNTVVSERMIFLETGNLNNLSVFNPALPGFLNLQKIKHFFIIHPPRSPSAPRNICLV